MQTYHTSHPINQPTNPLTLACSHSTPTQHMPDTHKEWMNLVRNVFIFKGMASHYYVILISIYCILRFYQTKKKSIYFWLSRCHTVPRSLDCSWAVGLWLWGSYRLKEKYRILWVGGGGGWLDDRRSDVWIFLHEIESKGNLITVTDIKLLIINVCYWMNVNGNVRGKENDMLADWVLPSAIRWITSHPDQTRPHVNANSPEPSVWV